jgi:hypothetical protein
MEGERGNEVLETVTCVSHSFHQISSLNNQADYVVIETSLCEYLVYSHNQKLPLYQYYMNDYRAWVGIVVKAMGY